MSGAAKKLVGQTAAYGISSIVGRVLNYLLFPLYTGIFAPEAYGVVTELYAYVAFLNIIFTYGMETAFFRFANRTDQVDPDRLYNHTQSLLLLSSILFSGLLILFSNSIAEALSYPQYPHYIVWLALIIGIDAIVSIAFAKLRLQNKAIKFASIRLANVLLVIMGNIFFLVICKDIYEGAYLSGLRPFIAKIYNPELSVGYVFLINLLANFLYIPMLWSVFRQFRFTLDVDLIKPMLRYAYPLMIMGLAGMVNEVIDRILLKEWLPEGFYPGRSNLAAVGIYGACYKLSILMSLAIQAFRYAAEPFFFSQAQQKNSPGTFAQIMKWFVICCAFIFVFISVNLDIFQHLLRRPSYREGLAVVPVLLLANLFLGVYYNLSVWFKLSDRTHYGTYIGVGGALITIFLNWLLIPVLGYMGCAIATLACYFSMAMACYLLGNKYYPIPYPVKTIAGYLIISLLLVGMALSLPIQNVIYRTTFHLALCGVFLFIVFLVEKPRLKIGF